MSDALDLCLSASTCQALLDAVPRAQDFNEAMGIIDEVRRKRLGDGLLTVNLRIACERAVNTWTTFEDGDASVELSRIWTSDPVAYPVAGRKRKTRTAWTLGLLNRAEVFVGEGAAALAAVFDDHARLAALGLQSIVNVPLLDRRASCFATFNVLTTRDHWLPAEILLIRLLAAIATSTIAHRAAILGGEPNPSAH